MKEYTFIAAFEAKAFEKGCERLLAEGWTPQGGIAVSFDEHGNLYFAQAFVR